MKKASAIFPLLVFALLAASGCAEKNSLASRLQIASEAVSRAEAAGAAAAGSADLQLARQKLDLAGQARGGSRDLAALRMAEQARLDANVAELKARAVAIRQAAAAIQEESRGLQQEAGQEEGAEGHAP